MPKRAKSAAKRTLKIRGSRTPSFGDDLVVVRTGRFDTGRNATRPSDEARVLVRKAGAALSQRGLRDSVVFAKNGSGVFAYSVDPNDHTKIVRRSSTGKLSRGRFVGGRFKAN